MTAEIIGGSRNEFGPRTTEKDATAISNASGMVKEIAIPVKFDDLPAHLANDVTGVALPANSIIKNIFVIPANVTFAGGTSYAVDLVEEDGTAITTAATLTLADMNNGGSVAVTDSTVGAVAGFITLTATGVFTAGEGVVHIEYYEQSNLPN